MPWHIEARDGQFCVVKDADDTTEACHDTEEKAKRHMAALYANEPKAELTGGIAFADDDEVAATFKADVERRTITGL